MACAHMFLCKMCACSVQDRHKSWFKMVKWNVTEADRQAGQRQHMAFGAGPTKNLINLTYKNCRRSSVLHCVVCTASRLKTPTTACCLSPQPLNVQKSPWTQPHRVGRRPNCRVPARMPGSGCSSVQSRHPIGRWRRPDTVAKQARAAARP